MKNRHSQQRWQVRAAFSMSHVVLLSSIVLGASGARGAELVSSRQLELPAYRVVVPGAGIKDFGAQSAGDLSEFIAQQTIEGKAPLVFMPRASIPLYAWGEGTDPRAVPIEPTQMAKEWEKLTRDKEVIKKIREIYDTQNITQACAKLVAPFRGDLEAYYDAVERARRKTAPEPSEGLLKLAADYEAACLVGPDSPEADKPFIESELLKMRIGVLLFALPTGEKVPFCSAYAIDSSHLVTARHCFYRDATDSYAEMLDAIKHRQLTFAALTGPGLELQVESLLEPPDISRRVGSQIRTSIDFVYLGVSGLHLQTGAPAISKMPRWDEAYVVGHFPFATVDASPPPVANVTSRSMRWSRAGCRVAEIVGSCVYHSCQTTKGFSGAPIFAVNNGVLEWAGIHTEPNGGSGECVMSGRATGNVGVSAQKIMAHPVSGATAVNLGD